MAAGLGYKEFTTGDVLTAADANGYLASQVVMVFADAADRTADLTSPEEGMISYLKDTNAVEKYDGAAWVSVGAPSASGLVFITSEPFTSSSTVSVNNCFTSTYSNYRVIMTATGSTSMDITCRLRVGGADSSAATYSNRRAALGATYTTSASTTGTSLNYAVARATNRSVAVYDFTNPQATLQTNVIGQSFEPDGLFDINGCTFTATTSFDGFSLICSSGNITGTVTVYAYANS
jgi:hypothetical protein